ncbi:uncharacterized protein [Apostichopus japonicus]|uniref:uncharacterized protein n=1 Tax=Stichopus japonicus TaxID=307972 RepID=UPI003AB4FF14
MMADKSNNYRTVLADVADELTDNEAKDLAFELVIPRGERCKINNGRTLIDVMEKHEMVSEDNVDQLLKLLRKRCCNVAATKLEGYKQTQNTSTQQGAVSHADTCDSPSGQEQTSSDRHQMDRVPRPNWFFSTHDMLTGPKLKRREGNEKDKVTQRGAVSHADTCDSPSGKEQTSSDRCQTKSLLRPNWLFSTHDMCTGPNIQDRFQMHLHPCSMDWFTPMYGTLTEPKLKRREGNEKDKVTQQGAVSHVDTCDSPSGKEQTSSDRCQMNPLLSLHLHFSTDDMCTEPKLKRREGNEKDKERLNELIGEKVLKFEVHDEYNLNYEETEEFISKMAAKKDHNDCFFCCFIFDLIMEWISSSLETARALA